MAGLMLASATLIAQNNQADMLNAFRNGDKEKQEKILKEWNKEKDNNPAYYLYAFDYYYVRAFETNELVTTDKPKNQKYYEVPDSNGNVVAYLTRGEIDKNYLSLANKTLDEGIAKFPNSVELRAEKLSLVYETGTKDIFEKEMYNLMDYAKSIDNKWVSVDEKSADAKVFADILVGLNKLLLIDLNEDKYTKEDKDLTERFIRISEKIMQDYPKNNDNICYLAFAYATNEQFDEAINCVQKAEFMPSATKNLLFAEIYAEKGDKENAIKHCDIVINDKESKSLDIRKANDLKTELSK